MSALSAALDRTLSGSRSARLAPSVDRLMTAYQSHEVPSEVLMSTRVDALAYAGYRMPSTSAAVAAALGQVRDAHPDWSPASFVDLGAGTGAASWAVAEAFPGAALVLLEQSAAAVEVGREVATDGPASLARADWRAWTAGPAAVLPTTDVVLGAYLLGELADELQRSLVASVLAASTSIVLVEPGTPAGYRRVLAARTQLLAAGWNVLAPCPHDLTCPLADGKDWCHFSVRVQRSALHRRLKDAQLSYEDEKFSFVAATREPVAGDATARVLRHPQIRKGLVQLELCTPSGTADRVHVSKREGPAYKRARGTDWGDAWS